MNELHLSPLAIQLLLGCAMPSDQPTAFSALHQSILTRARKAIARLFDEDGELFGDLLDEDTLNYLDKAIAQLANRVGRLLPGLHVLEATADPVGRGLALLSWLSTLGIVGEWQINILECQLIYIGVQPVSVHGLTRVHVDSDRITVRSQLGEFSFVRVSNCIWRRAHGVLGQDVARHAVVFHAHNPIATRGFAEHLPLALAGQVASDVALAMGRIQETSASLSAWIDEAIAGVICLQAPPNSCSSGSSVSYPGLVFVTHPMDVEKLAVLLVHEASHIYLNALSQHVQLVQPGNTETIYSPFRRLQRPVEKVLLAFHAAANMVRYTSGRLQSGDTNPAIEYEYRTNLEYARNMHEDLSKTSALTEAGTVFLSRVASCLSSL
ncbi:aKG-HExxH-type peptide beta-hydroxylase [Duganella sacchari]|nr:HEXXH motif-containing putative peptide modification protein [Duganella sacchari]